MTSTLVDKDLMSRSQATLSARAMSKTPPKRRPRSGPLADLIFGWPPRVRQLLTLGMLLAILGLHHRCLGSAIATYGTLAF